MILIVQGTCDQALSPSPQGWSRRGPWEKGL